MGGTPGVGQGVILHHALRLAHVERTLAEEVHALTVVRAHPELVAVRRAPNHVHVLVRLEGDDGVPDEHPLPVGSRVVEGGGAAAHLGGRDGLGRLLDAHSRTAGAGPDPDLPAVSDGDVDAAAPLGPAPGGLERHDPDHDEHRHELPATIGHLGHSCLSLVLCPVAIRDNGVDCHFKEQSSIPYLAGFVKP